MKNPHKYPDKLFPTYTSKFDTTSSHFSNANFLNKTNNENFINDFLSHNLNTTEVENKDLKALSSPSSPRR
jgi:hypothetical protein